MNPSDREDIDLIKKFKQGDESAFELLYNKHKRMIVKLLMSKGVPLDIALDYCQDIFISLFHFFPNRSLKKTFIVFLNQIIHNKVADYYRNRFYGMLYLKHLPQSNQDNKPEDYVFEEQNVNLSIPEESVSQQIEFKDAITHCLKKIENERWRTIILLWIDGYQVKQISEILGMPIGSVSSAIGRCKIPFIKCINANYFHLKKKNNNFL